MGDMSQPAYGGYEYRAAPGPAPVAVDGYGGMLSGPPPQIMMVSQPGPPGEEYNVAAAAANAAGWNAPPPSLPQETEEEKRKREAAIATEVRNQRASLKKQRDDYMQRAGALKRELKILKQQRADLSSGREPPSPTTNSFIKENDKLQSQIQTKLSTIENVIDMLEGIIGKDKTPTPPPPVLTPRTPPEQHDRMSVDHQLDSPARVPPPGGSNKERKDSASSSASPERLKNEVLETMKRGKGRKEERSTVKQEKSDDSKPALSQVNHVFYDPELHWCSTCDIFPKTAKDYLNHLHSTEHTAKAAAAIQEYPWRDKLSDAEEPANNPALPPKRVPIRGLQFFVPAPAWYCKLCNYWMGDLHCASTHLKSSKHRECYAQFIDSHANFEIDWMSDRQKAYERMRDQAPSTTTSFGGGPDSGPNDFLTSGLMPIKDGKKKKSKKEDKKDKKKKKRSKKKKKRAASSSSSSDSSDSDSDPEKKSAKGDEFDPATSIRVAMRNLLKAQEAASKEAKAPAEETAAGKWTVVQSAAVAPKELTAPPPPFMTEGAESREKKRDELMISQWVTPEPIISEKEKQMLEQLKGKLKKREEGPAPPKSPPSRFLGGGDNWDDRRRSKSPTPPWRRNRSPLGRRGSPGGFGGRGRRSPPDRRGRDRSPLDRGRDRSPLDRGMRDRSLDRRRDRSMDRGGRGSRDRDMNRGFGGGGRFDRRRGGFGGRRSPSPNFGRGRFRPRRSFSRSRSRSRSRGRRVIEKPIVNFPPEPKPKLTKKPREKKDDDKKDKKPVSMSIAGQKKLPFIGRMPVFKKQQQDAKKEELTATEHPDVQEPLGQENGATKTQPEEFCDMMPDPYQYVALMGAAPPPPPNAHPGKTDQNILPPGIDEADADLAPKPISDAPIPRKGPLPKDFQQALDILFDGDKPKPADVIANETKPPELPPPPPVEPATIDTDQPQMIVPEAIEIYNQQMAAQYNSAVVSGAAVSYDEDDESQNQPLEMTGIKSEVSNSSPPTTHENIPHPAEASEEDTRESSKNGTVAEPEPEVVTPKVEVENEETRRKRAELEELAMLGIDADDMAAQIF